MSKELSRRAFLRWGASAVGASVLAACGSAPATTPATQSGAPAANSAATSAPVANAPASAANATVNWLIRSDMGPKIVEWFDQSKAGFEATFPSYKVNVIGVPWGDYNAKLMAMYAAGQQPEVSANFAAGFGMFYLNGAITSLDEYLGDRKEQLIKTLDEGALAAITREGKLYGLPVANLPTVVFYNKRLLDQYGIATPPTSWDDKTWTFDSLLAAAQQIAHDLQDPTKAEWGLNYASLQLGTAAWVWGADPFNAEGGPDKSEAYRTGKVTEVHYNRPEFVTAMQTLQDLAYKQKVSPSPSDIQTLGQTVGWSFLTNRLGLSVDATDRIQALSTAELDWEWGIAPLPYGPTGSHTSPLFNDSFMLSKGSAAPEAGFELIWYLATGEAARSYAQITGFFPANSELYDVWLESAVNIPGNTLSKEQLIEVLTGAFKDGFPAPGKTLDRYVEINNAWTQTSAPIWANAVDAKAGLDAVQTKIESLIQA